MGLAIIEPCQPTILAVEFEYVESVECHARIVLLRVQLIEDRESLIVQTTPSPSSKTVSAWSFRTLLTMRGNRLVQSTPRRV